MVNALVGARVSHVQGEEKTSHLTQRSKGEAYAESQGWTVIGSFEDLDVSAIKLSPWERPDLRTWLTDRAGEWDALIFAKTDRVFRSAADCVRLAEWCRGHGKILVLVDDGIKLDYFNPEDAKDAFAGAMSKVFLILASVFAEIEGQRFVQRARDRVAFLRHTDRWGYGIPPFGFEIVEHPTGPGKALAHDHEAQRVLASVVEKLLSGASLVGVTAGLNENGVLSPRDWLRHRKGLPAKGNQWTVDKLRGILTNPSTQGVKTSNGKQVLDAEGEPVRVGPPSFDQETWHRLQDELQKRASIRPTRHSSNPLLGVAKCGDCGRNLRQRSQTTPSGVTHRYYVCGSSPKACLGVSIVASTAEAAVEEAFLETHADRRVLERVWRVGSDHSAELESVLRTIEALREDRAMGLFSTTDDELMYRSQMTALVGKRDVLSDQPIVKAGWIEIETGETYAEKWPSAGPEERRALLTDRIRLVVYRPNQYEVQTDYEFVLGTGPTGQELIDRV